MRKLISNADLKIIHAKMLYLSITDPNITAISIQPRNTADSEIIDLNIVNNNRIIQMAAIDKKYTPQYDDASKIRVGVYTRLLKMLQHLPNNLGIAYFEGYRPLWKQKEYFDHKFKEILQKVKEPKIAYEETSKLISSPINNIPGHCTGAAIDMTLFELNAKQNVLLDLGKFDVISGENSENETFCTSITAIQKENRYKLLLAAAKTGLINYANEWWHYSYGDKAWAYVNHLKFAKYGLIYECDNSVDKCLFGEDYDF